MLLEVILVAAVLVPVACTRAVRGYVRALLLWQRVLLGAMLVLALAAQFGLEARTFPFVDWRMYSSLPHGDPVVYEYDVLLRGGGRDALVPGRYLGPESADRLMEGLRRHVDDPAVRDPALVALARLYRGRHVDAVVVSARRVRIADGSRGAAREIARVRVP